MQHYNNLIFDFSEVFFLSAVNKAIKQLHCVEQTLGHVVTMVKLTANLSTITTI